MGVVTALEPQRRTGRVNIFIDGEFALGVQLSVVEDQGLKVGQEVSEDDLKAVTRDEERRRAINNAVRMLESRSRSKTEIISRLNERGYSEEVVDVVLAQLTRAGLVDDQAFAKEWVGSRSRAHEPVGRIRLKHELKLKGIDPELTQAVLAEVNEAEEVDQAVRAAKRHTRPYSGFKGWMAERQRLAGYLQRRGYNWATTKAVLKQVLSEPPEEVTEEIYED